MKAVVAAGAVCFAMAAAVPAFAQDDDYDGLPPGEGRDLVYGYCGACHSNKLVAQQGLSRERWDDLLVWMVEEQGMYPLEEGDREAVLDYLATELGPNR